MGTNDLIAIFSNLSRSLPSVQALIGGLSYLLGIVFIMIGLARLREHHDNGGQGGESAKSHVGYAYILSGGAMLYMPTMMTALSNTLFGSGTSVLEYSGYNPYDIYTSITMLIETIGLLWFLRGCVLLAHSSNPAQGEGNSNALKGFLFLLAGLFSINFKSTVNMMNYMITHLITYTSAIPT